MYFDLDLNRFNTIQFTWINGEIMSSLGILILILIHMD